MTIQTYHEICDTLRGMIAGTEWEGHVFAVGGCCRDEVMGREINDVDLAVTIRDGGVGFARWLFANGNTVARPVYFERYGTAMLQLKDFPEHEIEIVQTRKGKYGPDNEEDPGSVFGTIDDDAFRRDFTVNSLFYDISAKKLIDVTGLGLKDIAAKKLRTPASPELTFYDDPVRILRCIRMASAWHWDIDAKTMKAMIDGREGLKEIKPERRRAELEKMLMCADPVRAMKLVRSVGVMNYLMPELQYTYKSRGKTGVTQWTMALKTLDAAQGNKSMSLHYAALLYVIADTPLLCGTSGRKDNSDTTQKAVNLAEHIMRRLHYHSHFLKEVQFLIRNCKCNHRWGDDGMHAGDRMLMRLSRLCVTSKRLNRLLDFLEAVNIARTNADSPLRRQIPNIRSKMARLKLLND